MKAIAVLCYLLSCWHMAKAQVFWPTTGATMNTFRFASDTLQGSAFVVKYRDRYLLITAKHIFKRRVKSGQSQKVTIMAYDKILTTIVPVFFHDSAMSYASDSTSFYYKGDVGIDVAVMECPRELVKLEPIALKNEDLILGEECMFLGYPMGLRTVLHHDVLQKGIVPFVKRAYLSGGLGLASGSILFLDGHNNGGFSGGPVLKPDRESQHRLQIIGVVSGYTPETKRVAIKHNMPKGSLIEGFFGENSGLITVTPISPVIDIAEKYFK